MDFNEEDKPLTMLPSANTAAGVQAYREISVGAGTDILKSNSEGFFIGGNKFSDAPYSITYTGKTQIRDTSGNVVILIDPNG